MKYNKLVRDKIPEIIIKKKGKPVTHTADEKEYWEKLKNKLVEETAEYRKNDKEEELADVLEVLYAIFDYKKIDRVRLETIRIEKANKRGGFKKKIILEES